MTERMKNMNTQKFDRRRKYYLVLDCETATLPYAINFDGKQRQTIAIAKPLIYDLGWQIIDRQGNVYAKRNYLISEIFSVPSIFNTAFFTETPFMESGISVERYNMLNCVDFFDVFFIFRPSMATLYFTLFFVIFASVIDTSTALTALP